MNFTPHSSSIYDVIWSQGYIVLLFSIFTPLTAVCGVFYIVFFSLISLFLWLSGILRRKGVFDNIFRYIYPSFVFFDRGSFLYYINISHILFSFFNNKKFIFNYALSFMGIIKKTENISCQNRIGML